jgi:hypothetical protein
VTNKHFFLSEGEIAANLLPTDLQRVLGKIPPDGNVLDWGCGRGKTVLRLRDAGVPAWGIDVDPGVLAQAGPALSRRGLEDAKVLRMLSDTGDFRDGYFSLIYSEETLEHVADLEGMAIEAFRLTAAGGLGLHSFPGKRQWLEPHVKVPFVHWMPNGPIRKACLQAFLLLGAGPQPPWPETIDENGAISSVSRQAGVYARYLQDKVHYRKIEDIAAIFLRVGFQVRYRCLNSTPLGAGLLPLSWRQNGFPAGNLLLELVKPEQSGTLRKNS